MTRETSIQETAGTGPTKIFVAARADLMAQGVGKLTLQVTDPSTVFYLNVASEKVAATTDLQSKQ
jgi:hypothetical protein